MANKPIQSTDIASADVFTKLITDTKALIANMEMLDKSTSDYAKNVQKLSKGFSANQAGDVQQAIQTQKQLTAEIVEQEKRERAKIQTKKTLISLEKMQASSARQQAKEQELLTNAYKRESKQLNDLRNAYKNLAAAEKANTKEAKAMLVQITKLDTKLKGIDQTVGQSQRNVGNYGSAFGKLGGALKGIGLRFVALTSIIYGLGRVLTSSYRIFADFQQGSANLASVLGKSRSEIKALTDDAKRLGATTAFTASQVTDLQTSLSKLGFKEKDILNATEGILALAAATGTDLGEAATVTASTLNAFNMDADETQRVVDVMAKSFSSSALDMEKFSTAMAIVAPVANTAGQSIEQTTAMLGVLTDAGIDASTAGTGLRNIFLDIAKKGIPLDKALEKIRNSSNKNATAMELFGKRGATVATVLADNSEKADELAKSLNNAGGAAQEMADTQLDTLTGATTRLSSAWEGFILSLEDGDGVIAQVLRGAIDLATDFLTVITELTMTAGQLQDKRLGTAAGFGAEEVLKNQQSILKFQQMSNDELQKEVDLKNENYKFAKAILQNRKDGLNPLEQEVFLNALQAVEAKKKLKAFEELEKRRDEFNDNEWKDILAKNGIEIDLLDIQEKRDKAILEGINSQSKELAITRLKKASEEELLATLAKKAQFEQTKGGQATIYLIEQELQRRKDIKATIVETNEEIDKKNKKEKDNRTAYEKARAEDNQITIGQSRSASTITTASGNEDLQTKDYYAEKLLQDEEDRIQAQKDLAQNLTDVTIMLIDKRIEALDREAEAQKRNHDEAKQREQEIIELRKAGAVNTAESLAFEREAQAKALKEQEKIAKKKQRLELTNSAINMFNASVQNGNGNPLGKTMADVSALVGFIRTLPAFWSGTDTTVGDALGTQISSGRDGILARVDKSEMILNKGKVDKLAGYGITTTDGILDAIEGKRFVANSTSNRAIVLDNSEVVAKLDKQEKLLQQIASRPHESTDIEKISNAILITQQLTQGNKVTNSTKVIRTKG